jgi:hypothetical protein
MSSPVIRWDDVPDDQRASYSYATHRGCQAAVKSSYGTPGYSRCSAGVNQTTGFCRKHSEKLGLLSPLSRVSQYNRPRCECGEWIGFRWNYCPECGRRVPDTFPILPRKDRNIARYLHGHTLAETARLRRAGTSWLEIARQFGCRRRKAYQEPEWAIDMAWENVGSPGIPPQPSGTEYEDPAWDVWRAQRRAARDQWLQEQEDDEPLRLWVHLLANV